jgi:hypothetical protein
MSRYVLHQPFEFESHRPEEQVFRLGIARTRGEFAIRRLLDIDVK